MGKDPKRIEPLVPVDLVVDHSVMIDHFGTQEGARPEHEAGVPAQPERYQFMKWGMQAFDTFGVVPPGFGIVHQVNLEYLARGVHKTKDGVYYPDTLVGTDSHTTMINGIGVVGWGVGGIEAEAGMLGQPVYFLTPDVVGFRAHRPSCAKVSPPPTWCSPSPRSCARRRWWASSSSSSAKARAR
jgi:aconitate hydratase